MYKRKTIVLMSLFFVALLIIFFGIKTYNKPHIDIKNSTPEFTINSQKIVDEFQNNEVLANKKYLDKIIQIKGKISKIEATEKNDIIITIQSDDMGLSSVICHLLPEENKNLNLLKQNQSITLKGICTGYLMDVIIIRCNIVNI